MGLHYWIIQAFNGISYGALLFLVGSGLSLIFGVMRIVNLSHGAYFLWGGYIALSVIWRPAPGAVAGGAAWRSACDGAPVPALEGFARATRDRRGLGV